MGPFDVVSGEALAEDTRFEPVRGCPQHAFQLSAGRYAVVRRRPRFWSEDRRAHGRTPTYGGALDKNQESGVEHGLSTRGDRL
jgi:hypothetical protein